MWWVGFFYSFCFIPRGCFKSNLKSCFSALGTHWDYLSVFSNTDDCTVLISSFAQ